MAQFIESFDSVRLGWDDWRSDRLRAERLQAFSEVLLSLALGEQVIVPQPYAFDSLLFAQVAGTVLRGRDAVEPPGQVPTTIRPFVLNLFNTSSFKDSLVAMLRRSSTPDAPFHRSLLPDLAAPAAMADQLVNGEWSALRNWLEGDDRSAMLDPVIREFAKAEGPTDRSRVVRPGDHPVVGLRHLVERLIDDDRTEEDLVHTALARAGLHDDTFERIEAALRRLKAKAGEVFPGDDPTFFDVRSKLRPFHDASGARITPAQDLAGEALPLVTEFVDTLYNIVLVDSYGSPPASFSTGLFSDAERIVSRGVAQTVALAARFGQAPGPPDESSARPGGGPQFQLTALAPRGEPTDGIVRVEAETLDALEREGAAAAEAILSLWKDDRFIESRDRLVAMAPRATSEAEVRDVIGRHLDLVSATVSKRITIEVEGSGPDQQLALTVGSAGAAGALTEMVTRWNAFAPATGTAVAAVGAIVGSALPAALASVEVRRHRRRKAEQVAQISVALGSCLNVTRIPQVVPRTSR